MPLRDGPSRNRCAARVCEVDFECERPARCNKARRLDLLISRQNHCLFGRGLVRWDRADTLERWQGPKLLAPRESAKSISNVSVLLVSARCSKARRLDSLLEQFRCLFLVSLTVDSLNLAVFYSDLDLPLHSICNCLPVFSWCLQEFGQSSGKLIMHCKSCTCNHEKS